MRVLVYGMSASIIGGIEIYLMNLYKNFDLDKLQFDFIIEGEKARFENEINELGGEIFYITPKKESFLKNIRDLNKILKMNRETHEVVYLNHVKLHYNIPFILSAKYKYKIAVHSHLIKTKDRLIFTLAHYINRVFVRNNKSTSLFACSNMAAEWLFGVKPVLNDKVKIINNAINAESFTFNKSIRNDIRKNMGLENKFVVGNIGRLSLQKNPLFLLEIFNQIYKRNKDAVLFMVGDGEMRAEIEKEILKLELKDNVILTGNRSDIQDLLQAMDVFLFPSNYEGLGIVIIEAQAAGLKCIVSADVIPQEVKITDLVEFVSLKEAPDYWAERVLSVADSSRRNTYLEIKKAGFHINDIAIQMQNLFLKM
ncbi:glycosyltransferase [Paenibacillus sp. FSL F4-0125]|uniref:glycosyltransferase n=1 Tax=Paenibacillus sp. FSL F4-0125 TaxID=2954730 RepID=UPI0030F67678